MSPLVQEALQTWLLFWLFCVLAVPAVAIVIFSMMCVGVAIMWLIDLCLRLFGLSAYAPWNQRTEKEGEG